jgi:hypothetical protein
MARAKRFKPGPMATNAAIRKATAPDEVRRLTLFVAWPTAKQPMPRPIILNDHHETNHQMPSGRCPRDAGFTLWVGLASLGFELGISCPPDSRSALYPAWHASKHGDQFARRLRRAEVADPGLSDAGNYVPEEVSLVIGSSARRTLSSWGSRTSMARREPQVAVRSRRTQCRSVRHRHRQSRPTGHSWRQCRCRCDISFAPRRL